MPVVARKRKVSKSKQQQEEPVDHIALYEFHGIVFRGTSAGQKTAKCPFCRKPEKFYVDQSTGLFDCKSCGVKGNKYIFLQKIYKHWHDKTTKKSLTKLAKARGISLFAFKRAGVAYRSTDGVFLLPSFNDADSLANIGTYTGKKGDRIYRSPGCKLHLGNINKLKEHGPIYIVEGDWDGMALDYLLSKVNNKDSYSVIYTSANIFKDEWMKYIKNRDVVLIGDNDEPGENGVKTKIEKIGHNAKSLKRLHWPESYEDGYDLNDFIADNKDDYEECWAALQRLIKPAAKAQATKNDLNITKFSQVIEAFKKNMHITKSMEDAIALCLAVIFSAREEADPLWLFLVAPPGGAKTLILQNMAGNDETHFESSLTPKTLISGWKSADGEDTSLLPDIIGKTLIIKDWTEIMAKSTSEQEEIYGVFRGAYDGRVERSFGNGIPRRVYPDPNSGHKTCHFSLLAGVTHKIFGDNRASMGERFIKFKLDNPNPKLSIQRAISNTINSKMAEFSCRDVVASFLQKEVDVTKLPTIPKTMERKIIALAEICSCVRVQVERKQGDMIYRPEPEVATRLAKQLVRTARFLSVVFGEKVVSANTYRIVQLVSLHTSYSYHQDVFLQIAKSKTGLTRLDTAARAKITPSRADRLLYDFLEIGVVTRTKFLENGKKIDNPKKQGPESYVWKLSNEMRKSYFESNLSSLK